MGVPTKIILEGSNILIKDAADNILKVLISQETFAHPSNVDVEFTNEGSGVDYIYFNNSPSNRETFGERISISCSAITVPVPPLGGWNMNNLLQELSDNYLGKTNVVLNGLATEANQDAQIVIETNILAAIDGVEASLNTLNANDFATEATLNNLKTFVESDSKFSNNSTETTGTVNAVSFTFAAADTTRKQLTVVNTSTKKLWVSRNNPAVVGVGIPLNKEEVYIEDIYRGALYGIYESGTGNTYVIINDTV